MKIAHLIFYAFVFILLLFSITTYINFKQSEEVRENAEYVARSGTIIRHSSRFQRNTLNMLSGLRGYLITGENYFIQAYDSATKENITILKELSQLIEDPVQQKRLGEINNLNSQWVNNFAQPLVTAKLKADSSQYSLASFNNLYRQKLSTGEEAKINLRLQQKFREFSNHEYEVRDQKKEILASSVQRTKKISFYLTLLSFIAGLSVVVWITKRISGKIIKMEKMADSIAEGNYKVSMKVTGKDELSKLAHSLNHMAAVLSENISLLKRKNEELDQYAHVVSHDLKAPLRGIGNVISWIEEDHSNEISPAVNEYIQLIKGRVTRSENLIQGILSYARAGKEIRIKEEVDVAQLVHDIIDSLSPAPGLQFSVSQGLPVLFTERVPLQQVLSNLIDNAVKYHNKPEGKVVIYHKEDSTRYRFFVEDNGPGIASNYHKKIFIIFQTLQERDSFESTGVGLAIVKKILDARNEEITLVSEPGKGSVFSFTWQKTDV